MSISSTSSSSTTPYSNQPLFQFGGLASGLDTSSIINALIQADSQPLTDLQNKESAINSQISEYGSISSQVSTLESSIQTLTDSNFGGSMNIFGATTSSSSNSSVSTVSSDNTANPGSFNLNVLNMATSTQAQSTSGIGLVTTGASAISAVDSGSITTGNFTIYVNNQAQSIAVNSGDTVQNVLDRVSSAINTVTGQAASGTVQANGQIQFSYATGTNVSFGAQGDTSNFSQIMQLATGTGNSGAGTFTSLYGTSTTNLNGALVGNASNLKTNAINQGTFTINGVSFTIGATTTLNNLVGAINSNSQAGVLATYDPTSDTVKLVSKSTGNQAINLSDNGTNFLQDINLVNGTNSLGSQTLGKNAQFQINGGATIQSQSNTINSATTGITGVTLNLQNTGLSTITVQQDNSQVVSAITGVVNSLNSVITTIDKQVAPGATLQYDPSLTGLRDNLITQFSDALTGLTGYNNLSQIGITTGAVTATPSSDGSAPQTFQIDSTALNAAINANPTGFKQLLIGDPTNNINGVLTNLLTTVTGALDPTNGVFASFTNGANTQIANINDDINNEQDRLNQEQKNLEAEYTAMDQVVSQYKSMSGAVSSLGINTSTTSKTA